MTLVVLSLFAAITGHPAPLPMLDIERPADRCAVGAIEGALEGAGQWRDLTAQTMEKPLLAAELDAILPGYRLAFVHEPTLGLLLVLGERDSRSLGQADAADWREAAEQARRSCSEEAVACEVSPIGADEDLPYGIAASSRMEQAGEIFRRETVAFSGPDSCRYRLQFTGPEAALDTSGWRDVRGFLEQLHRLVLRRVEAAK